MVKKVIWGIALILGAALLQSTVLSRLTVYIHAVPDLALCILVFSAYVNGTMTGQLTGFFSGFLLDFLSASPLGLNALIRTITGALIGRLKDTFFLDIIFLPMALCAGATAFKALLLFLLYLLFAETVLSYNFFGLTLWLELALNIFFAPFLFALLRQIKPFVEREKEKA
jgi:rod shape-determining protein MreD